MHQKLLRVTAAVLFSLILKASAAHASPLIATSSVSVGATADKRIVVAVSAGSTALPIKKAIMRKFFSGSLSKRRDGTPVHLILSRKGSPEMTWLCEKLLGMPEEVYRRFILARVFRGEMKKPLEATTPENARRLLVQTPGAIGPIRAGLLGEELHELPVSN